MPFPVGIDMVKEAEAKLGGALPSSFVGRMLASNGGELIIDQEEWLLHPFLDTTDASRLRHARCDITRETASAREWETFPSGGVAIASNGNGDQLVFLPDPDHTIRFQCTVFTWSHETGELDVVVKDFGDLK